MADEADMADALIEKLIKYPTNPFDYLPKISPTGKCHYCDAGLELPGQLFCDGDCAKDWADQKRAQIRQSGKAY